MNLLALVQRDRQALALDALGQTKSGGPFGDDIFWKEVG